MKQADRHYSGNGSLKATHIGRNVAELIHQIKAFHHVRATGEATPSGWKPGKMTLKPGPNLVGNVWKVWKTKVAF
jgi:alkyl hydroperoxide reductase subunit AhpC